jgi:AAA domain
MKKWDWICDEVEEGREREGEQMTWWEKVFDEVEEEHKRKRKGRQTEDAGRKHQAKAANGDGGAGQQRTDGDGDRARGERKPKSRLIATPYLWRDPTTIKPRDFLYGDHIVRGYVTGLVSTGGVGKTSEIQVEIAAMLTGRELLGVKPKRAYRVWYINLEDPLEEIDRRMAAIFKHYGISEQDIGGRFFRDSGRSTEPGKEGRFVIAREGKSGIIEFVQETIDYLHATVRENAIDFVVVDPFVNSARFAENDNNKMAAIIEAWAGLAEHQNCAIELVHHVRKSSSGHNGYTIEDARGAVALVNSTRSMRVCNTMTKEEGEKAGVERHRSYFRIDNGKANMAPPPEDSKWRKIVSVDLDNAMGDCPSDRVGVVTLWEWPNPMDKLTVADLRAVQKAVSEGGPWRKDVRAENWVGKPIATALHLDLESKADIAKIKGALKIWIENKMLKEEERDDDKRRPRTFIEVGIWANDGETVRR